MLKLYFVCLLLLLSVCVSAQEKGGNSYLKPKFKDDIINNAAIRRSKKLMQQQLDRFWIPRYAYLFRDRKPNNRKRKF